MRGHGAERRHAASGGHMVDFLFTIALFCAFAATSLIVVVIGANVYQSTVRGMNESYALRTSLSYVTQKVRQNDGAGEIRLGELEGIPALVLEDSFDSGDYQTWIYYDDGWLRELFTRANAKITPADGQPVLQLAGFEMEQDQSGMLTFTVRDEEGSSAGIRLYPRCGSGTKENGR